ncbi:glyoxalase/Bleomycin resistance /Dioxygenase superfamily protein [Ochrobactrum quorumnocens]|uniref:Glyoxalase/Bleomycin resistance /Dioxygenase superfamily protein n=1 Tax=Ochrobactrum quorumnocens TaxID=271865 RepID=A0A248UHN1_9HYPH|nr:VOC family protein [[Ochrobactrum] quorumnocens]ASV85921.1 glyoxalase/Bleomycin resistance /Dioxygenase superfamily protein [[Ochrobactrum] quorumnocens]KAA9366421.1 VOC family protein [[Ochrobactrum] quorumnocens]MBD7992681.1 VOC family protein [Ochrobactrum gallinarum]
MNDIANQSVGFGRIAVMIPVKEMDAACQFYCGALGFKKVFENGNPVGFMILKRDEGELHLSLQKDHKAANFNIAHMLVKDVDAMYAICKRHGMRIIKGLQDKDYGLRAFVFEDPDGNRIDVGQKLNNNEAE